MTVATAAAAATNANSTPSCATLRLVLLLPRLPRQPLLSVLLLLLLLLLTLLWLDNPSFCRAQASPWKRKLLNVAAQAQSLPQRAPSTDATCRVQRHKIGLRA